MNLNSPTLSFIKFVRTLVAAILCAWPAGFCGAALPGSVLWTYTNNVEPILASPAIGSDGTIYVGSYDQALHAINPIDGTRRWRFSVEPTRTNQVAYIYSTPAIGPDGTIYFGTDQQNFITGGFAGNLYAVNPNGTQKWKFPVGSSIYSDPAIGSDGTIYVGCYDQYLYAVNPNGTLKWKFLADRTIFSDPVIAADGTVYFGCDDHNVYALNANGTLRWKFPTGLAITASPAIGPDGTVYIGSVDNNLYAIHPNGTTNWFFTTAANVNSSAAVGSDSTIYFGSDDQNLYALRPDGTEKWRYTAGGAVRSSPALAADGTIYFGAYDGLIYAIDANGTFLWSFTTGDYVFASPVIAGDGTIYAASADHNVYALHGGSGLSGGHWPMFRHDAKHTAREPGGNNTSPVLTHIGNKSVAEETLLTFTAMATDADVPMQTLTFSLDAGFPTGASITSGGVFTWTPTEAQGPGTYNVTVRVTDNGSPAMSAAETITITVNEVNVAPVLTHIGNKSVAEETLLTFTATATDADVPAQTLTFSLDAGFPAGASITSGGVFTWAPTEAQGPGTYDVTVRVTDNGSPAMSAAETITITVSEVNVAPTLAVIPDQAIHAGMQLTVQITGSDTDLPLNTLTYGLSSPPVGATINATTGLFSWTPTADLVNTSTLITVTVTDDGSPNLSSIGSFKVRVAPRPMIESITHGVAGTTVTWTAIPGRSYRVQFKSQLADLSWNDLPGDVAATGALAFKLDPSAGVQQRFYRVIALP